MSVLKKAYKAAARNLWFRKLESAALHASHRASVAHMYYAKNGNFGDELNNDVMRYFDIPYQHSRPLGADVCCIGSNMEVFLQDTPQVVSKKRTVTILGSGFIADKKGEEHFAFPMDIRGLRGQLSKKRCEAIMGNELPDVTLGDPGLLIRRIFPDVTLSNEFDVGIICHVVDKQSELVKNITLDGLKVKFIDIEQSTALFVQEVAQCSFILSSAMHGLICADSLGIPNKHIVLSDKVKGGEYKFRDYYSVFDAVTYQPIYLKDTGISTADIQRFTKEYTISQDVVTAINDRIEATYRSFKVKAGNV